MCVCVCVHTLTYKVPYIICDHLMNSVIQMEEVFITFIDSIQ